MKKFEQYKHEVYKGFVIEVEQDSDPQNPREWDNAGALWSHKNLFREIYGNDECFGRESSIEDVLERLAQKARPNFMPNYEWMNRAWERWNMGSKTREEKRAYEKLADDEWQKRRDAIIEKNFVAIGLRCMDGNYGPYVRTCHFADARDAVYFCDLDTAWREFVSHDAKEAPKGASFDYLVVDPRDETKQITLRERTKLIMESELDVLRKWYEGEVYAYTTYECPGFDPENDEEFEDETVDSCCGFYGRGEAAKEAKATIDAMLGRVVRPEQPPADISTQEIVFANGHKLFLPIRHPENDDPAVSGNPNVYYRKVAAWSGGVDSPLRNITKAYETLITSTLAGPDYYGISGGTMVKANPGQKYRADPHYWGFFDEARNEWRIAPDFDYILKDIEDKVKDPEKLARLRRALSTDVARWAEFLFAQKHGKAMR